MFLGTYLLLQGWPEGRIGVISFIKDIVSLFFQTPMVEHAPRFACIVSFTDSARVCFLCRETL